MPSQLEALLQQARSALADSNSSLLNNRYPVYPGQTRPEMSALTARKRQIEDNYRLKRPSYTKAIQHATHRATGFKDGDVQSLLDRIQSQQQNLGGYGIQRIKNIFGNAYSGNLQDKINKDTLAKNAQSRVGFDNLANEARNIDTRDNTKTLQTLNALSLSKNATKEGVLGLLDQFGNQKHAYDQAKFNADRAMFNRQANYPYSRSQGLGDAISGGITIADAVRRDRMNAEQGGEFNPLSPTAAEERYAENRLRRGMNNLNTAYPVYPGKLIADLTPDMKLSYNLAERLEPNIQDNSYDERRNLRKRLTDGDITSQRALASLNEKASPLEKNLDKDVQRAIKQVTAKINASRVMSGTFGSKSHQSELDAAIRDIVSGKYGSRANITTDTLSRNLQDLSRENDVTNERVRELDRTGTREITDALNQIRNINQRGATQWGNEQNTLNQQFQQFSDEADWENNNRGNLGSNPQNRGLAIAGGIERASSQSPLVLPQALQFNNLQANIPFEESKVAAPTTDPRIQRTSQLFNDEEEMRRIAEAARERQNREELARREAELMRQREEEEAARRAQEEARQREIARQQEEYRRIAAQQEAQRRAAEAAEINAFKSIWADLNFQEYNRQYSEFLGIPSLENWRGYISKQSQNPGYRFEEYINDTYRKNNPSGGLYYTYERLPGHEGTYVLGGRTVPVHAQTLYSHNIDPIIQAERRYHGNALKGDDRLRDFLNKTKQNPKDINSWLYLLPATKAASFVENQAPYYGLDDKEMENAVNNHILTAPGSSDFTPRRYVSSTDNVGENTVHTFAEDWLDKVKRLIKENPNHPGGKLPIFSYIHGGDRGSAVPIHWMDDKKKYLRQILEEHFEDYYRVPAIYTAKPPEIDTKNPKPFIRYDGSYYYPNPELFTEAWKNQPNNELKNLLIPYLKMFNNGPSRLNTQNRDNLTMRDLVFPKMKANGTTVGTAREREGMMNSYRYVLNFPGTKLIRMADHRGIDRLHSAGYPHSYKYVDENIKDYLKLLKDKGLNINI